ncbi:INO80 complex, subunit Ies4 [Dendryphion nanum]|uniref:INO80 complex, subunit Ies4 n=1 Tax=Dendryphion nanum TaxID=256645 RepID=A0A9P9D501_9PLEO|nr:INO80 complex, subunit Ies4 [Dendryphion nanum]
MATKVSSTPSKSKIAVLKLSSDHLAKFPHTPTPSANPSSSSSSSSVVDTPAPQVVEPTPVDTPAESAATPLPVNGDAGTPSSTLAPPPVAPPKRKGIPGPKPGSKRGAAALTADGLPKPRGKPGPKKKQKLGDMINDPNNKGPFAIPNPVQKLGPKANQGAINAGLRALDRTGKPCRKWEKKGFQLRSFTGVEWDVPTWRAPKKAAAFSEDVKSDSASSSEAKVKDESSAVSDKSGLPGDTGTPVPAAINGLASSPAPVAASAS